MGVERAVGGEDVVENLVENLVEMVEGINLFKKGIDWWK